MKIVPKSTRISILNFTSATKFLFEQKLIIYIYIYITKKNRVKCDSFNMAVINNHHKFHYNTLFDQLSQLSFKICHFQPPQLSFRIKKVFLPSLFPIIF